jgi:hypothetical protein
MSRDNAGMGSAASYSSKFDDPSTWPKALSDREKGLFIWPSPIADLDLYFDDNEASAGKLGKEVQRTTAYAADSEALPRRWSMESDDECIESRECSFCRPVESSHCGTTQT